MSSLLRLWYRALSTMDIALVSCLLSEKIVVSNTSREFILLKISDVFKIFQLYKNDTLLIYATRPRVAFDFNPFILVGNKSRHYIACSLKQIGIDEWEFRDDECHYAFPHLNLDCYRKIELAFFKDEMINFVPSNKYYTETKKYQARIDDLISLSEDELDINILEYWLDEASDDYAALTPYRLQFRSCFLFYKYYNILLEFKDLSELEYAISDANLTFESFLLPMQSNSDLEHEISEWMAEYAWLYEDIQNLKKYSYLIEANESRLRIAALANINYNKEDLEKALKFMAFFESKKMVSDI